MLHKISLVFVCFFFFTSFAVVANEPEFQIAADEITHIKEGNQIVAKGNVEIHYMDYILKSKKLVYLVDENRIVSDDKMEITYQDGSKIIADKFDVTTNLYNITAKNFKMMFPVSGEFKASAVKQKDNGALRLKHASFSSCKLCYDENRNEKPLVWSASANNITYNKEKQTIAYKSLWLEMFDYPVLYLPYFYHPAPDVKRKTGFLFPSFGSQSDIGEYIETPFFANLSDYSDLTITPKFATDHKPILSGEYRHNFTNGKIDIKGMITDNDEKGIRGQIDLFAGFDINDIWQGEIDFERVSDDTVLKFYELNDDERAWIESKASLTGTTKNSNISFNLLSFQDLRADVVDESIPDVIPYIEYNRTINNLPYGSYFKFHSNILDMERNSDFNSTRRIATTFEYTKPYISPFGALFNFSAFAAANIYSISDYEYEAGKSFSGNKMFLIPNLIAEVRYPFTKKQQASYQVIEPIIQFIAAPNSEISNKIPNEDSQDFEFQDASVIQQNHFSGYDRYDIGSRINYGINWTTYGQKTGKASVFIGQSYRVNDSFEYPANSGFDKNVSDIVGSVMLNPSDKLFADLRFRFDNNNLKAKHNEFTVYAGPSSFRLNLDYLYLKSTTTEFNDLEDREEINFGLHSRITKHWNVGGFFKRDLRENRNIEFGGSIYYDDECFQTGFVINRSFTSDRDYSDGLSVKYNIIFKGMSNMNSIYNLGEFND